MPADIHTSVDGPVRVEIGDWATLADDAHLIRHAVFVEEQHVPDEIEQDQMDPYCLHAVAYDVKSGAALGTGRLLPDGHIGRMAVLPEARGRGIGGIILRSLMQHAQQRGHGRVVLNAQTTVQNFYTQHGFDRTPLQEFEEAGIAHVEMQHVFSAGKASDTE
ncbi:GNAT family N-acetyltransferase [Massilia sp. W12]|uniref:GNAT family N-acetyltransferase n=1 Tax=Massilia sp. W12 TaxID=3126507 RepID=UPI0030D2972E